MSQIRINKEAFLQTLTAVSGGLSTRNQAPEQSECYVFSDSTVMTYNGEIAVRAPSKLGKTFTAAVRAKPLLALIQKMDSEDIGLEIVKNQLVIQGRRETTKLTIDKKIELEIATVGNPDKWHNLPENFTEAIELVSQCTEKETKDSKFTQVCVYIAPEWIEAWGRIQMARYKIKTGLEKGILVRQASIKHILSFGMKQFGQSSSWLHFRGDKLYFSFLRFVEGEDYDFPNLEKYYKNEVDGIPLTLPKAIIQAAKKAHIITSENEKDTLLLELRPGKMRVIGTSTSGEHKWRSTKYTGPERDVYISAKLLSEIATKHSEVMVTKKCIRVDNGKQWTYLASLERAPTKE